MTQYVLDENGFLVPYDAWKSGRDETAKKIPESAYIRPKSSGGSSLSKKSGRKKAFQANKLLVKCPYCKASIGQKNLENHIKKVHGRIAENAQNEDVPQESVAAVEEPPSVPVQIGREMDVCPVCNVKVRKDRLESHIDRVHTNPKPRKPTNPSPPKPKSEVHPSWRVAKCPFCGEIIKEDMEKHVIKFHLHDQLGSKSIPKKTTHSPETTTKGVQVTKSQQIITCPVCKISIREDLLKKHLKKAHSNQSVSVKLVKCTVCGVNVKESNLEQHMKKVHYRRATQSTHSPSPSPIKQKKSTIAVKQADPTRTVSNVILKSKRGTKLEDMRRQCNECGVYDSVVWHYSSSNYGPVLLCARCKSIVFDRSFDKVDAMDIAFLSHFESNPRRH